MMIIFQGYLFGRSEFKAGDLMPAIDARNVQTRLIASLRWRIDIIH